MPTINTAKPRKITLTHTELDTVFKAEAHIVSLVVHVSLLPVTACGIRGQEVLDVITDFSYDSKLF